VNANQRSISLTQQSVINVKSNVNSFLLTSERAPILQKWQHLDGYLNWILNILP
ncbi:uncharacterized protein BT62DRAFT_901248, partial [Guyanagaster necrorhizus]